MSSVGDRLRSRLCRCVPENPWSEPTHLCDDRGGGPDTRRRPVRTVSVQCKLPLHLVRFIFYTFFSVSCTFIRVAIREVTIDNKSTHGRLSGDTPGRANSANLCGLSQPAQTRIDTLACKLINKELFDR